MSDLDWDDDEFEVPDLAKDEPPKKANVFDEEEEEDEAPVIKKPSAKPAPAKKKAAEYVDETLADPVAEKLRRQKLVEEADLEAAKELFGTDGEEIDLGTYAPKSEKEFVKFGTLVATKYLTPFKTSAFYKEAIKSFVKSATKTMSAAEVKEVEAAIVAIRNDKVKSEKAESAAAAKAASASATTTGGGKKKKFLNQGGKGGDSGLEDYKYDTKGGNYDDDYDFM